MISPLPHPNGRRTRVLLSSVFGPFAQDDQFGSRSINPMELYHNQVTRAQGPFSLRMFHRSWGILMIQENISAPCTVLDFPTLDAFVSEIKAHRYDIIGISSIIVNLGKVREMCRLVRLHSPHSEIVVGGHVAAIPGIEQMIDADHIVKGEGIAWMRAHLGEDPTRPIRHPEIVSGFGVRALGLPLPNRKGATAATVIPSVGCPLGCNFCTTSAFFGGKGKSANFYESGREIFEVMESLEALLGVHAFFLMDENFLLLRRRAMELLDCMKQAGKSWELYVFSSANAIGKYSMEELVQLGVSWVWIGLESPRSGYAKLSGADTIQLARDMRANGIKLLGSTIIGLEHHTPDNIHHDIDYAVAHATDFHQFMLYTPVPGTPLHAEMAATGQLLDTDLADIHGQFQFNFLHPAIAPTASKQILDSAFQRDYEVNGPSLFRICETILQGWRRHRQHPEERVRIRFAREAASLKHTYGAMLWAMERYLRQANSGVSARIAELRSELRREFGWAAQLTSAALGPLLLWSARREQRRLDKGITYEPPTFLERKNWPEAFSET
jgi:hypothetical protein